MSRPRTLIFIATLCSATLLFSQEEPLTTSMESGAKIYKQQCAKCHTKKGTGKGKRIPPLAQSDYLLNNIAESMRAIKYGLEGEITVNGITYDKVMQPIKLSDKEIADVMNYILNSWGNTSESVIAVEKVSELTGN